MLVLSRKLGERIVVPKCGLVLTVLAAQGRAVRLGISAPDDVAVFREEVLEDSLVRANIDLAPRRDTAMGPHKRPAGK